MVYKPSVKHTKLKGVSISSEPKPSANNIVGVQSTGYREMDNSQKISGGSVLMSSSRANNITPRTKASNKDKLVRTVF